MKTVLRTFDLLDYICENYPKNTVFGGKKSGEWIEYSAEEYRDKSNYISSALIESGVQKGDHIISASNNRPEWNIIDMAIAQIGAVHIPLYPNLVGSEYKKLIIHSDAKYGFVSSKLLMDRISPVVAEIDSFEQLISIEPDCGVTSFDQLLEIGSGSYGKNREKIEEIKSSITEDDLFSIIYTSGTTGDAKGVMLAHRSVMTNAVETSKIHPVGYGSKSVSFLPLSHIYEKMMNLHMQYKGISIYYAQNMGTVVSDMKEVKPDMFTAVPRFLEKVYDTIISKGDKLSGIKRKIFFWAVELGKSYSINGNGTLYELKLKLARKLIFDKWLDALGGNIKVAVTGGAAIQPRLMRIFGAAGFEILEGYGLSETGPVIGVNHYDRNDRMIGTVGLPLEGVDVRLGSDGEITCKGPNLMLGYYKDPEYTATVMTDDGYFKTGDIGEFIDGRFVKITDRKKSIFKLSAGKYIAPQVLENKLNESMFIEQSLVCGAGKKFVGVIISIDQTYSKSWASRVGLTYTSIEGLIQNKEFIKKIKSEIAICNKELSAHEHIKSSVIVADEWSVASGELSATMKIKRDKVLKRYSSRVIEMFPKI